MDSPVLHLRTFNRSVAVFLDGKQLYTDCPEQSSGVGELALPMLGWDRTEPVVISLPPDYLGKTLTIAQSTGLGEKQLPEAEATVYPCPVTLSCGYAYESGLIAQSFQTAVPAALCCAAALLLLALMVWQAFHGKAELGLLWAALALFFWMLRCWGTLPSFTPISDGHSLISQAWPFLLPGRPVVLPVQPGRKAAVGAVGSDRAVHPVCRHFLCC